MLSESQMKRLKEHSKMHKGGMKSKHMRAMIKAMEDGDSFNVAHNKAVAKDKKSKPKGKARMAMRTSRY